jgi:DNA-binding XRE family transcriptional regulator
MNSITTHPFIELCDLSSQNFPEIGPDSIAYLFKITRKTVGLTQVEVAQALDVSQSFVSKIEKGELTLTAVQWFQFCTLAMSRKRQIFDGKLPNPHI